MPGVAALLGVVLAAPLAPLKGQEAPDSLLARLRRAEAAIAVLQQQVAEQSEGGVGTRSGAKLTVSGRVATHVFRNDRAVNNTDNPQFALNVPPEGGLGMSLRQTRVRIALSGLPRTLGGEALADMDVDFYGGQQPSSGGRHFPLLRVRTARGFIRWSNAEVMIGQESPLMNGVDPVSPAAIGTPLFATAGNLWLWLPQARVSAFTQGPVRLGWQVAVLAPTSGDAAGAFDTENDRAEASMRPFLQTRAFARFGDDVAQSEVGCGAHHGWLDVAGALERTGAIGCDAVIAAAMVELRGEFVSGQALRGLGGGGVGQNFDASAGPLRTQAGWVQLNVRPAHMIQFGAGVGTDRPEGAPMRTRNDAVAVHGTVRPIGAFLAGAEWRRLTTRYPAADVSANHVTLSLGVEF